MSLTRNARLIYSTAGLGHEIRCGALADHLGDRGWNARTEPTGPIGDVRVSHLDDVLLIDHPGPISFTVPRQTRGSSFVSVFVIDAPDAPIIRQYGLDTLIEADILICPSAGATASMFAGAPAKKVLAGPEYALLRPEFRYRRERLEACLGHISIVPPEVLDLRAISGVSVEDLALQIYSAAVHGDKIITYGGMRALEAACIVGAAGTRCSIDIEARNEGERLNAAGLLAGEVIDGLGCSRIADALEELVR